MTNIVPIKASSQHHVIVADIIDDVVLTKDGGAALVLRSTALNFSLLSEKEQEAVTVSYAALLNSLSFPIQILVRSQKKDITRYLAFLDTQEKLQTNPQLKNLMVVYKNFVSQMVKKRNVLEKEFYIVIPFSPLELGVTTGGFIDLFTPSVKAKKTKSLPYSKSYIIKKAKTVLYPKRDHLIRQAGRLGIKMDQLTTEGLATLFFKIYNPVKENNTNNAAT
ncbi:MAG: hypothetical protein HY376_04120 [Candidatus Blackburnbacteria bacterium]|nr:hypothetical protein [Candidatus Blackburnbacteria bacterium]